MREWVALAEVLWTVRTSLQQKSRGWSGGKAVVRRMKKGGGEPKVKMRDMG